MEALERMDRGARYIVAGSDASSAMPAIAVGYQGSRFSELLPKRRTESGNREDI